MHCIRWVSHGKPTRKVGWRLATAFFLVTAVGTVSATTYISVEPVPSRDLVGAETLAKMESIGYAGLERWSQRLTECRMVDNVIDVLLGNGVISSVNGGNTRYVVGAGGFEGGTNPSFVFTIVDSGQGAVSAADVNVLDNALGFVFNQGGTVHFSPDHPKAYAFGLDYAVVSFTGPLFGVEAKAFFDYVGTVDPALWSGQFAGFTQIDFAGSLTNNSMLFLQPAVSKRQFTTGLYAAASGDPRATYFPLKINGQPTTATAGVAFPGNDWVASPNGAGYLVNIGNSPRLQAELEALRQQHLAAIDSLVRAIDRGNIQGYLESNFRCPS
jgi:hypothetical protein